MTTKWRLKFCLLQQSSTLGPPVFFVRIIIFGSNFLSYKRRLITVIITKFLEDEATIALYKFTLFTHTLRLYLYALLCIIFNLILFFPRRLIFSLRIIIFLFFSLLCRYRMSVASVRPESISLPQFSNMANGKMRLSINCISLIGVGRFSKSVKVQARFVANFLYNFFCKLPFNCPQCNEAVKKTKIFFWCTFF